MQQATQINLNPDISFERFVYLDGEDAPPPDAKLREPVPPPDYFSKVTPVNELFFATVPAKHLDNGASAHDGAFEFNIVARLGLSFSDFKGFRVYPVYNDEKPPAWLAEHQFSTKISWGAYYYAKARDHDKEANAATYKTIQNLIDNKKESADAHERYRAFQEKIRLGTTYFILQDALASMFFYEAAVWKQISKTYPNMNILPGMFEGLLQWNKAVEGSTNKLQNIAHLLNYMGDVSFNKIDQKLHIPLRKGVLNRHFYASFVLNDNTPIMWFCFTIRTVGSKSAMLLHGWSYSLLGPALQNQDGAYRGRVYSRIGATALSLLLNVAAVLNNKKHLFMVYMEALPGTENVIKSMRKVTKDKMSALSEEEKDALPYGRDSPYLRFTNQSSKGEDVMYIDKMTEKQKKDCQRSEYPDKLFVDENLLNFWKHSVLPPPPPPEPVAPPPLMPVPPQFQRGDESERPWKQRAVACPECGLVDYCGLSCEMEC